MRAAKVYTKCSLLVRMIDHELFVSHCHAIQYVRNVLSCTLNMPSGRVGHEVVCQIRFRRKLLSDAAM